MKSIGFIALGILILSSCEVSGVKKKKKDALPQNIVHEQGNKSELEKLSLNPIKKIEQLDAGKGVKITYFLKGNGPVLKDGMVAKINYEVRLENGEIVDGNVLLKRPWLPFLVGYGMQTPGWDVAMRKLRVGDFVEIYLPSKMARGEKGVNGLIPPNSSNILRIKVMGIIQPTKVIDGTKIWLLEENKEEKKLATTEDEVEFHYMVGTESNPKYDISYRKNQPYVLRFSDYGIIKGLKKALINAKKADKLWILVPPAEAYGEKGLLDIVKSNEHVFYDIFVLDVR